MRSVRSTRLTLFVLATAAGPLTAQAPAREVTLGAPNATHPFQFSLIRGIREQANGGILAAASLDGVLMRIDQGFRRTDTLGRKGRGPGEYLQPDGIWPLAADSSLLVDLGNNRLTVIDPGGKLGATTPILGGGESGPGTVTVMIPGGVDRSGGIYFRGGPGGDSIALNRLDRGSKKVTRVATLKAPDASASSRATRIRGSSGCRRYRWRLRTAGRSRPPEPSSSCGPGSTTSRCCRVAACCGSVRPWPTRP
jgi:hypothetical protein